MDTCVEQAHSPGFAVGHRIGDNGKYCSCSADLDVPKLAVVGTDMVLTAHPHQCDVCRVELQHPEGLDIYWSVSGGLSPLDPSTGPRRDYWVEADAAGTGHVLIDVKCPGCNVSHCSQKEAHVRILEAKHSWIVEQRDEILQLWEDSVANREEMGGAIIHNPNTGEYRFESVPDVGVDPIRYEPDPNWDPPPGWDTVGQAHTHPAEDDDQGAGGDYQDGPSEEDIEESHASGFPYYVIDFNCDDEQEDNDAPYNGGSGIYEYDPNDPDAHPDDNPDRQTPDNPHGVDPEAPPDWADPVVTWEELDP